MVTCRRMGHTIIIVLLVTFSGFQHVWSCISLVDDLPELIEDFGEPDIPKLPPPDRHKPIPFEETSEIVNDLLGPLSEDAFKPLRGGGLDARNADDLYCDFESRCCWHNVNSGSDDLEWVVLHETPDPLQAARVFASGTVPDVPFAITGSSQTHSLKYAMLASCPITCQKGPGTLLFLHWTSAGVTIDVCILPLDSKTFSSCETVDGSDLAQVEIPVQKNPFTIVFVASEFTRWPGGVAAVDEIEYDGALCSDDDSKRRIKTTTTKRTTKKPTTTTTTTTTVKPTTQTVATTPKDKTRVHRSICESLHCTFEDGTICKYQELHPTHPDAHRAQTFNARTGRTGNWAAGVIKSPPGNKGYAGGRLHEGEIVVMRSAPFDVDEDVDVEFKYWEQAHSVHMRVCYDGITDNCRELSGHGTGAHHRKWRQGHFVIPKGNNRQLYFVAENDGIHEAAVGVSPLEVIVQRQHKLLCETGKKQALNGAYQPPEVRSD